LSLRGRAAGLPASAVAGPVTGFASGFLPVVLPDGFRYCHSFAFQIRRQFKPVSLWEGFRYQLASVGCRRLFSMINIIFMLHLLFRF